MRGLFGQEFHWVNLVTTYGNQSNWGVVVLYWPRTFALLGG
jgi:hypothetical protein